MRMAERDWQDGAMVRGQTFESCFAPANVASAPWPVQLETCCIYLDYRVGLGSFGARPSPFLYLLSRSLAPAHSFIRPASESPTEVVRSPLTEVFRILEDEKLKDPAKLIPADICWKKSSLPTSTTRKCRSARSRPTGFPSRPASRPNSSNSSRAFSPTAMPKKLKGIQDNK